MNVPVVGRIDAGSVPSSTDIETCRYTGVSSRTSISTWCCSESNATSYISDSDKTVRSSSYDFSDHRFISASRTFCHRSRRFISECYTGTWYRPEPRLAYSRHRSYRQEEHLRPIRLDLAGRIRFRAVAQLSCTLEKIRFFCMMPTVVRIILLDDDQVEPLICIFHWCSSLLLR